MMTPEQAMDKLVKAMGKHGSVSVQARYWNGAATGRIDEFAVFVDGNPVAASSVLDRAVEFALEELRAE